MDKNNKSSILVSVLCGVAVCFACLGIVFLLPTKNTSNLKGNNSNNINEITLGDECTCSVGTLRDGKCYSNCSYYCGNTPVGSASYNCGQIYGTNTYVAPSYNCNTVTDADCGSEPSGGGGGSDPTPSGCDTAPCCINGSTVTNASVCMETSGATCGACPVVTSAPTAAPTANTCSIPSCKDYASQTNEDCRCKECFYPLIASSDQKSCVSQATPAPTETPTTYTITFAYADGLGRVTQTCQTDANGKIITSTCSGDHIFCGEYSIYPCVGYDCKEGIGDNQAVSGKKSKQAWLSETYTRDQTVYCVAGTSGGTPLNNPTPAPGETVTPTSIPATPTPAPVIPKCYLDENNGYHWTSSPESSWVIATDKNGNEITNSALCPPAPACYVDTNGNYVWGEYSAVSGYVYHAELTDESSCKEDLTYGCYMKDNNYVWTKTPSEGYTQVDLTYDKCENPACYYIESSKQRTWGYFSKVNGYYKIVDENDNDIPFEQCINEACYKCDGDRYVWGDYSADKAVCEIVPSVTDITKCKDEVPVAPTGISVSTIVYTFMAILMAFGIGFIYYSTVIKKNS